MTLFMNCLFLMASKITGIASTIFLLKSDLRAQYLGFDTRSGHLLSFLLPLTEEGQLLITGESKCSKFRLEDLSLPRKKRLIDHTD